MKVIAHSFIETASISPLRLMMPMRLVAKYTHAELAVRCSEAHQIKSIDKRSSLIERPALHERIQLWTVRQQ
jgi:hypothetical protein